MNERGRILVIGGEKGGVGKSTIATNLSVSLTNKGAEVIIVDTDLQKTSINWIDRRNKLIEEGKNIPRVHGVLKDGNVRDIVKELADKYDIVIIDAAGTDSKSLRTSLTIADHLYTPIKASQADLETLPHMCQMVDAAKDINENLESKIIISMAPTNPFINEVEEASELLNDFSDYFKISNIFIRERKVYRDALLEGMGVVELHNDKARNEIEQLTKELLGE